MKTKTLFALLFVFTVAAASSSCRKDKPIPNPILLTKINHWDTENNSEHLNYEFLYDSKNVITAVNMGAYPYPGINTVFSPVYDPSGKLIRVKKERIDVIYTLIYNAAGQVIKASPSGDLVWYTHIYRYNAAGKVEKMIAYGPYNSESSPNSIMEYTWSGDNIQERKTSYSSFPGDPMKLRYTTKYLKYDDKPNPFALAGPIVEYITHRFPLSKNNVIEYITIDNLTGITKSNESPVNKYNSSGNIASMDLSGSMRIEYNSDYFNGQKFYYNR